MNEPEHKVTFTCEAEILGAQVEQVGEHPASPSALFVFDFECYPEAKILSSSELMVLRQKFSDWYAVGKLIGASEAFARQNAKNNRA